MTNVERVNMLKSLAKLTPVVVEKNDEKFLYRWECMLGPKKFLYFDDNGELFARTEDLHDFSIERLDKDLLHWHNWLEKNFGGKDDE